MTEKARQIKTRLGCDQKSSAPPPPFFRVLGQEEEEEEQVPVVPLLQGSPSSVILREMTYRPPTSFIQVYKFPKFWYVHAVATWGFVGLGGGRDGGGEGAPSLSDAPGRAREACANV